MNIRQIFCIHTLELVERKIDDIHLFYYLPKCKETIYTYIDKYKCLKCGKIKYKKYDSSEKLDEFKKEIL